MARRPSACRRSNAGASEKLRADAREDSDFDPIRDEPSFKALIGQ
jgi:hypothetical protein